MDPLLQRIESLPEHGCYSVTFTLDANVERSVVMKVTSEPNGATSDDRDADVLVPEANMLPGWSRAHESFQAVLEAVRAVDRARRRADGGGALLRDLPGGWDVSIGNVVLDPDARPACVAHGELEQVEPATFRCPTCGAQALYGDVAS